MSLVHVYGAYVPSRREGISANVHGLVEALRRAGADVRQDCAPAALDRLDSRRVLAASALHARRRIRMARARPDTDLVHHHVSLLSTALPFPAGLSVPGASRLGRPSTRRAPVLVQAWNAHYEPGEGARARLPPRDRIAHRLANGPAAARLALRGIADLVVASRHQVRQVEALDYRGRLHVVPNGVDLQDVRPRSPADRERARLSLGLPADAPVVLYYGHASPWKGLRTLMAAWPAIRQAQPRAHLLLSLTAYGRDRAWVEAMAQQAPLRGSVHTMGPQHVADLHAAADVAVLPAPAGVGTACFPNVLLECLAGGVPVVASRVGCVPEVIRPGRTGMLVPPADAGELAATVGALLADGPLRRRLASHGREAMEAGFGWDAIAQRMLQVYRGLGIDAPHGALRPPRPARPVRLVHPAGSGPVAVPLAEVPA